MGNKNRRYSNHTGLKRGVSLLALLALAACGSSDDEVAAPTTPPVAPTGVSVTARDGNDVISWPAVSGATSYNVYWSAASGVPPTSGTMIPLANNPQTHTGLTDGTTYYYVVTAKNSVGEGPASAEVSATPTAVTPTSADPLYGDQWNLENTGQKGYDNVPGAVGEDIDVAPVWSSVSTNCPMGCKGSGVRIAIVDDGLEIGHEDLAANIAPTGLSYNYVTGSSDPTNSASDKASGHGTSVAGIAAARDNNGLGISGAAPRANLVGYNLLQSTKASDEADAMTRGTPNVDISSNSWGAPDGNGLLYPSLLSWRTAIDDGVTNGRGGLGTNYIWAAGNGAPVDDSNYDGQANYREVIAVTAVNDQGKKANYAEPGDNIWISAPGGEYCDTHTIPATDRTGTAGDNSYNDNKYGLLAYEYSDTSYTKCMNGTSAATPQVAGVVALMLEANPALTWRDVRLILAQSARQNDAADAGWMTTSGTPVYHYNHKYGFGVVDANAAVTLATTWPLVGPEMVSSKYTSSPYIGIPDATQATPSTLPDVPGATVTNTIAVSGSGVSSVEYVEITFTAADHPYSGDLAITLTSPSGEVSQLAETHACAGSNCVAYDGWVFGSARFLGEPADGNWTIAVTDGGYRDTGHLQSWSLQFYGH